MTDSQRPTPNVQPPAPNSQPPKKGRASGLRWLLVIYLLLFAGAAGLVAAADLVQQEQYILPDDRTIAEDLYVSAGDVIIDGRIEGDLVVVASYVEINGTITGDLTALAAGVQINGEVGDDARLLTASSVVAGRIGGDWATTGGNSAATPIPLDVGGRSLEIGAVLDGGEVAGDALILAGSANLFGRIDGDLSGQITSLVLREAAIGGGADVTLAEIAVDEVSRVSGENGFRYRAPQPLSVPSSLSPEIVYDELVLEDAGVDWFVVLRQVIGAIAGFAILGWLLLRYRPNWIIEPVAILNREPLKCLFVGFVVALGFLFLPVATLLLVLGIGFFWGIGVALLTGGFVILLLILIWVFSPLVVGMWVGRRFSPQPFGALLVGIAVIAVFSRLPLVGLGISGMTFLAALGALILGRPLQPLPPQV